MSWTIPGGSDGKASACNVGDPGSIAGLGRSPGEGNGNPLQYSCLKNSMNGGPWWATVCGSAKSWTRLRDFTSHIALRVYVYIWKLLYLSVDGHFVACVSWLLSTKCHEYRGVYIILDRGIISSERYSQV